MNPLYVQTFRRHRRLFIGIVVVALVSAMWMNLGAPKMYRSAATLWADAPGADEAPSGAISPAVQEQTTFNQFLLLQPFLRAVAHRSPWPAYLKSHTVQGWGPGAILGSLRGGGGGSLEARIDGAVDPKHVTSAVLAGPHVLVIAYDAPSPALAEGTLKALVDTYLNDRVEVRGQLLRSYVLQLRQASAAAAAAHEKLAGYRRRHPGSSSSTVTKLEAAEQAANLQIDDARKALQVTGSGANSAPAPTVEVKVWPVPGVPTTGHKKLIKGMLAGLFAGLLVSALGVVALARGPELVRGSDAVAPDLDLTDMSDAELARLIHDLEVDVDEEWPAANGNDGPPDELRKRRTSA